MATTHSKKTCFLLNLSLFIAQLLFSSLSWSQSPSLSAHVHGEAQLMIAIEGQRLEIQLVSPAANILGFEHAPENDDQVEQIHHAENILANANALFEFRGADCSSTSSSVEIPYELHATEEHHSHNEHGSDAHESHTEIIANYIFECDSDGLDQIQIKFLTEFPAIETFDAQWITSTKQGAQELSTEKPWIDLR